MMKVVGTACFADRMPALAYIQFCPLPNGCDPSVDLFSELSFLHDLLGSPTEFPFWFIEVVIRPTQAFETIGKPRGSPETARSVQSALCDGPLFEFTNVHLHRIHELNIVPLVCAESTRKP